MITHAAAYVRSVGLDKVRIGESLQRALILTLGLWVLAPQWSAAQWAGGNTYGGPAVSLSGVGTAPVIEGHIERANGSNLGLGGFVAYWSYGEVGPGVSLDYTYVAVGGTGTYHFPIETQERLDPFVGLSLGYYIVSVDGSGAYGDFFDVGASRIFLGAFGGVRYFLTPKVALVGRVGFGSTHLSAGVDFRF